MILLLQNNNNEGAIESENSFDRAKVQSLQCCDAVQNRLWPAQDIQQYAIQCARCGKYRKVPNKEEYERLYRKQRLNPEEPWFCEHASIWGEDATPSCESQDQYATSPDVCLFMDKLNYPAVHPGWERIVTVRSGPATSSVLCDVYYRPLPSGKKLRSLVEIAKYIQLYPESFPESWEVKKHFSFAHPVASEKLKRVKRPGIRKARKIQVQSIISFRLPSTSTSELGHAPTELNSTQAFPQRLLLPAAFPKPVMKQVAEDPDLGQSNRFE